MAASGSAIFVLTLASILESDYVAAKAQIQTAIATYNTNHPGQNLTLDTTRTSFTETT